MVSSNERLLQGAGCKSDGRLAGPEYRHLDELPRLKTERLGIILVFEAEPERLGIRRFVDDVLDDSRHGYVKVLARLVGHTPHLARPGGCEHYGFTSVICSSGRYSCMDLLMRLRTLGTSSLVRQALTHRPQPTHPCVPSLETYW